MCCEFLPSLAVHPRSDSFVRAVQRKKCGPRFKVSPSSHKIMCDESLYSLEARRNIFSFQLSVLCSLAFEAFSTYTIDYLDGLCYFDFVVRPDACDRLGEQRYFLLPSTHKFQILCKRVCEFNMIVCHVDWKIPCGMLRNSFRAIVQGF
jgi:hypothetical protein